MKIKSSIGKNVTAAITSCREVLVRETINLLKSIGAKPGQDVMLKEILFLYQRKGSTTETRVCDRIMYTSGCGGTPFYMVCIGDCEMTQSDIFLSIDSLQAVYEAVRKVVREE